MKQPNISHCPFARTMATSLRALCTRFKDEGSPCEADQRGERPSAQVEMPEGAVQDRALHSLMPPSQGKNGLQDIYHADMLMEQRLLLNKILLQGVRTEHEVCGFLEEAIARRQCRVIAQQPSPDRLSKPHGRGR
ncbi:hypothetical protein M513_07276 [Trichuris suis]|uniref:Uncharacterized protein n=1 Tax=Trichuris suis TaxID=68888 RepID=A0A085M401_9BILA|nr:hypothetical protein M513_07276 [Trichuris suis]